MQGGAGPGGPPTGDNSKPQLFQPQKTAPEDEEKEGPYIHMGRHGSAWLLVIGSLMMLLTLVAPWWSWSMSTSSQSSGLYLFVWGIACFGYSCAGYSPTPLNAPTTPVLQAGNFLPNLGILYGTAATMSVVAALFGIVAAAMVFRVARGFSTYPKAIDRAVLLSYLSVAIALSTPVMMAVAQTSSFQADYHFPLTMSPNPGNSFYGSLGAVAFQGTQYTGMSWGPSYGWFLSIFGGVFFFAGGFVPHLTRHEAVTRLDLIRQGLLKLKAPLQRGLPPPIRAGLPAPMAAGAGPRGLPPPARYGAPAGYGYPGYQSLAPGVGWARAPPPMAPGGPRPPVGPVAYRPAALPAPATPTSSAAPAHPAVANAPGFAGRASVVPRPAASAGPPRVCPKCLTQVPRPAARCTSCGAWLP